MSLAKVINNLCIKILTRQTPLERFLICRLTQQINRKLGRLNTYINQLLKVGFDTIDFGSFISPKAIPQLKDTAEVLNGLDLSSTSSKLLAIIANTRGANEACNFEEINYLGFPLSVSEEFQKRKQGYKSMSSKRVRRSLY